MYDNNIKEDSYALHTLPLLRDGIVNWLACVSNTHCSSHSSEEQNVTVAVGVARRFQETI